MNLKTFAVLTGLVSASVGETVHGVLVFTRHGDSRFPSLLVHTTRGSDN